jgi:hypothetical protein
MRIDLAKLLAGHYSTPEHGLELVDSPTIEWKYDGYGRVSAHVVAQPAEAEKEE